MKNIKTFDFPYNYLIYEDFFEKKRYQIYFKDEENFF